MAALVTRTIDWIDKAPIQVEGRADTTASPDEVFAVLADHEHWPEWFPSVRKVTVLGQAEGVGARRRVAIPGAWFDEEFIVWDPGERWAFTAYAARPRFFRSLLEDCRLTPRPSGGTSITYTMYIEPRAIVGPLLKLAASRLRANNTRAMQNLAARAEGR